MSPNETKALRMLAEDYTGYGDACYSDFDRIAIESGLPRDKVRRTVRSLARKGFAEYGKGLWFEDGSPAGSGYRCTKAGADFIAASPPLAVKG